MTVGKSHVNQVVAEQAVAPPAAKNGDEEIKGVYDALFDKQTMDQAMSPLRFFSTPGAVKSDPLVTVCGGWVLDADWLSHSHSVSPLDGSRCCCSGHWRRKRHLVRDFLGIYGRPVYSSVEEISA